jgi:hypothetical protein
VGRPVGCQSSAPPTQGRWGPVRFAGRALQTAEVLRVSETGSLSPSLRAAQSGPEWLTSTPCALAIRLKCRACIPARRTFSTCTTLLSADPARFSPVLLRMAQSGSKWLKMPPFALWRSGSFRLNVAQNASEWLTFHTRGRPSAWPGTPPRPDGPPSGRDSIALMPQLFVHQVVRV